MPDDEHSDGTTLNYQTPGAQPPRWRVRWRPFIIVFSILFTAFILFCSGVSFPILGGASRDLNHRVLATFGVSLPKSAIVEHGARIAYRDPAYYFVLHVAPADVQPFIDAIRAARGSDDQSRFLIVGPPPPAWFDVNKVADPGHVRHSRQGWKRVALGLFSFDGEDLHRMDVILMVFKRSSPEPPWPFPPITTATQPRPRSAKSARSN